MFKYDVVIVSSGTLDTVFILKIIQKYKSKKILLITERKISENIYKISKNLFLDILYIKHIYFSYEFNPKDYLINISKIVHNYIVLLQTRSKFSDQTRVYFFNEFYNFSTFQSYSIYKKYKNTFIRSIRFLKIENFSIKQLFERNYSILKILRILINFFTLKIFFRELNLGFYKLDCNYYKKSFDVDYYKVEGFCFIDKIKFLKIFPYNLRSYQKNKFTNPLYLFSPVEGVSNYGINLDKTYENIFNYLSHNFREIDIKIHPAFKNNEWIVKLSKKIKINYLESDYPAEYFIDKYDKLYVNFFSNSLRHFLENNNNTNINFISLIDLIVFNNPDVEKKFLQMFNVVFYNLENKIKKII